MIDTKLHSGILWVQFCSAPCSVCVPLYITKRSEAVLQWGKRKNIKKMMINGELVIEWKKEKSIKDVVMENICYD